MNLTVLNLRHLQAKHRTEEVIRRAGDRNVTCPFGLVLLRELIV